MNANTRASAQNSSLSRWPLIGWLSYDFAASAYTFAIVTLFLPLYYTGYVLPFENTTIAWSLMVLSSYAIIAIIGPLLGAFADKFIVQTQVFRCALIMISVLIYTLIFVDQFNITGAISVFILLNVCFGIAAFLYDSHLITVTDKTNNITILSGIAWALGYIGGPLSVLLIFIGLGYSFPDQPETYKLAFKVISLFYLIFSLPVFFLIGGTHKPNKPIKSIENFIGKWKSHKIYFIFLAALFFMSEGTITVIYFAAIYSKDVLGFTIYDTVIWLGFGQFIGVFSTIGIAYLADKTNELKILVLCSVIWIFALAFISVASSKLMYFFAAALIGLVIGSIPSISRGYVGKIIPHENRAEAYSLMSTITRFAAIFGPVTYVLLSVGYGERYAILAPVPFFLIGISILIYIMRSKNKTA